MSKVSDRILKRVYLLFGAVALFSILILARVINIQYINGAKWRDAVQEKRTYERNYMAARGSILSVEGDVLAESQPFYRVAIDPSRLEVDEPEFSAQFDSLKNLLAENFGRGLYGPDYFHDKISAAVEQDRQHLYVVNEKVDFETYREMKQWPILRESKMRGGLIEEKLNNLRHYPHDSLARITLGLIDRDRDSVPLKGLEYAFHEDLKGQNGVALVARMPGGVEKPLEIRRKDQDGSDLLTTLSLVQQDIVEEELKRAVLKHGANYGVAILMEVETGAVRAMANYPEDQNRAVAFRIEPGSTFKLASAMALLEDRLVHPTDSVQTGNGTFRFFDRTMRDHLALGKLSFIDAFAQSSNVAFSKLVNEAYKNKVERWLEHLDNFGLSSPAMTRNHLVGEPDPIIFSPSLEAKWNGTTLPWMSIGYNTQLTPLQICAFYNAVANDGVYMEPFLVQEVRRNTEVVKRFDPLVLREQIASERTIAIVKKMMEEVVNNGTAKGLGIDEMQLAGKTGTAQKYLDSLGTYGKVYQASFAGYFPADNPRYTCYVIIDEPKKGAYYGANVAGPVFRNIARQVYATDLELIPVFQPGNRQAQAVPGATVVHQKNAGRVYRDLSTDSPREAEGTYVRANARDGEIEFSTIEIQPGKVPNVKGMSAKDATSLLEGLGLRVRMEGHGKVRGQSIAPGTAIAPRETISLTLN